MGWIYGMGRAFIITVFVYGYALMKRVEKIERNVAAALPAVPIDNKQERDAIRAGFEESTPTLSRSKSAERRRTSPF
jgi:hypothetical protein